MKLISIDLLKPEDKLSFPVNLADGRRFIGLNTKLDNYVISRIKDLGIKYVFIEEERFDNITYKHPISDETRVKAIAVYKETANSIVNNKNVDVNAIMSITKSIVDDIKASGLPIGIINGVYPTDDFLAVHAVNTAIYATAIGMNLGFNFSQLCNVSLAGFIHDIARKNEKDDDNQDHVLQGFEILRKYQTLNINSLSVIMQHHESYDGTGFPRKLKGEGISEFARIVSVADYFDTLVSSQIDLSLNYVKVYEDIIDNMKFDHDAVVAFKNIIQTYFIGSIVVINDGRQGIVVKQNKAKPLRPVVRLFSEDITEYTDEVDLLEDINLRIHKMVL